MRFPQKIARMPAGDRQPVGVCPRCGGMSNRATAGHMPRAVIEGLNYQLIEVIGPLESGLGSGLEEIVAVGGGARNDFWILNKADVLGRPVEVPCIEEATPLGAAILAGIGLGLYKNEQDAFQRVCKPGKTYQSTAALRR